eukprot:TRINITY_DN18483_c0_g1_i2.p1 TRINITY_DN18483_c0_g1~~TRINITY_DN18483_c0_g1_i2.p1  ORF type:complete len:487 (+),score=111.21 TRINITY_DN18483_c0_g1_i2:102-1463(+)
MEAKLDELLRLVMQHGDEIRTMKNGQDEMRAEMAALRGDHDQLRADAFGEASSSYSPAQRSRAGGRGHRGSMSGAGVGRTSRRSSAASRFAGSPLSANSGSPFTAAGSPGRTSGGAVETSPARSRQSGLLIPEEDDEGLQDLLGADWPSPSLHVSRLATSNKRTQKELEEEALIEDARRGGLWGLCQPLLTGNAKAKLRAAALSQVEASLARGESPSSWNGPGTPLRAAVQSRHLDLVHVLLEARGNVDEQDARGVSLLHMATFEGQIDICKLLIENKANANILDRYNQTPIFFAPTRSICELLFKSFADVALVNHKGQSALHLAAKACLGDVLSYLATRVTRALLRLRDSQGSTCVDYAKEAGVRADALTKVDQAARGGLAKAVAADKKKGVYKSNYSQAALSTSQPRVKIEADDTDDEADREEARSADLAIALNTDTSGFAALQSKSPFVL